MRRWAWLGAAFAVLILQTTSLGSFRGNWYFDLPLLFIYSIGLFYGAAPGALWGALFGLLQDISSPALFGFCLATRALVGYGIGRFKEMIFPNNYGYHVLIIGVLSLGLRLLYGMPAVLLGGDMGAALIAYGQDTLLYCLGNMLLTLPVLRALAALRRWVAGEDVDY